MRKKITPNFLGHQNLSLFVQIISKFRTLFTNFELSRKNFNPNLLSWSKYLGLYKYVWGRLFGGNFQIPISFFQSQNLVKKEREKDKKPNITNFIKFNSVCHKSVVKKGGIRQPLPELTPTNLQPYFN